MADVPLWAFHGRRDRTVSPSRTRNVVQALFDVGADPLYLEPFVGHEIWRTIYEDPSGDLYPWMFEGVAPPLATAIYNPDTGNLKLDARSAPGGVIDDFRIQMIGVLGGAFSLQPTMTVDGVVVNTLDFVTPVFSSGLTYNDTAPGWIQRDCGFWASAANGPQFSIISRNSGSPHLFFSSDGK